MAKKLIIVESPAKTRTLSGFLGSDYRVEASMGHVRDLPERKLSIDIENVAMAHSLSSVQKDILALRHQKRSEERQIRRLMDPQGAIPEIHDRLHLVRPNETIIYVKQPPR